MPSAHGRALSSLLASIGVVLGAVWLSGVRGQEAPPPADEPLHPQVALSATLARALTAAAPHQVLIRPNDTRRGAKRLGRSGVVVAPQVVVSSAANLEVFGIDDLVVVDAAGRAHPAKLRGRDLRLRLLVLHAPTLTTPAHPSAQGPATAGRFVLALGTPLRSGRLPTSTFGIVSAPHRFQGRAHQIDAELDASNSGGALVDLEGKLLGVCVHVDARMGERSGVGFAVPLAPLRAALPDLLSGKQLEPGRLGLAVPRVSAKGAGVEVIALAKRGAASAAGIVKGDRLLSVAGQATPDVSAFRRAQAYLWAGREVTIRLRRGDQERTVKVLIAKR